MVNNQDMQYAPSVLNTGSLAIIILVGIAYIFVSSMGGDDSDKGALT